MTGDSPASGRVKATYIQFNEGDASQLEHTTYYVSAELEKVTGYPPGKMIDDQGGTWWTSLMHPDDREAYWAEADESQDSGETYVIDYRLKHASGEWIWIREDARLVTEGSRQFWMGTLEDVTDQHPPS